MWRRVCVWRRGVVCGGGGVCGDGGCVWRRVVCGRMIGVWKDDRCVDGNWRAVARCAVLSAQDVRSVQSTVLCWSVLCVFVRGALRYVIVRKKAHASQP